MSLFVAVPQMQRRALLRAILPQRQFVQGLLCLMQAFVKRGNFRFRAAYALPKQRAARHHKARAGKHGVNKQAEGRFRHAKHKTLAQKRASS